MHRRWHADRPLLRAVVAIAAGTALGVSRAAWAGDGAPAVGPVAPAPAHLPVVPLAASPGPPARRWDWGLLPIVTYAPETSLGLGGVIVAFDDAPAPAAGPRRDDEVALFLGATLRKQFVVNGEMLKYWRDARYRLTEEATAVRFPNYFWGVGNDTPEHAQDLYTQGMFGSRTAFSVRAMEEVYVGAVLAAGSYRTGSVTPGGAVAAYVTGHPDGGALASLGAMILRDTRDDAMGPRSGSLSTLTVLLSDRRVASGFTYQQYELDQRNYLPLGRRTVLALEAYGRAVPGDVPLDELPALGGAARLRGYYQGRFRDHVYLVGQFEARIHLFSRFSVAPFGGVGNVFPTLRAISTTHTKVAGGVGLRFSLKKERDLNLRLDLAKSAISSGVYVNIGEAF